jgi:hypothetical protein
VTTSLSGIISKSDSIEMKIPKFVPDYRKNGKVEMLNMATGI